MNNVTGFMPKVWGKDTWTFIETIAHNYPLNPTQDEINNHYAFFMLLIKILPCNSCRDAYAKNIQESDTFFDMNILQNRDTLTKWVFNLRNKVNKLQHRNYYVQYDDVKHKYDRYRIKCNDNGCNKRNFEVSFYRDLFIGDFSIIDISLAKKFTEYAIKRGMPQDEIDLIDIYHDAIKNNNKILISRRNEECARILNNMILDNKRVIESEGQYIGKPSFDELKLIMRLNSNINTDILENMIKDTHLIRYRLKK